LPADVTGLLGTTDLTARLDRWLTEARGDEAAAARTRAHWLEQVAQESATFRGVLLDLAEHGGGVVVDAAGGRQRGRLRLVASDFCVLRTDRDVDVLLAYRAIGSVGPEPGSPVAPVGDRPAPGELGLAEAVAVVAADRPRVRIVTLPAAAALTGTLRAAGQDVITIVTDGPAAAPVYVPVAAIAELRLVDAALG
jgi:hypothetical protein